MITQLLMSRCLLLATCLWASWSDLRHRRIANWLSAATAAGGLSFAAFEGGFQGLGNHALHMSIALIGGMVLFRFGVFGGGDAKFYAAVASWFSTGRAILLLLTVSLFGVVLLFVWFAVRRLSGKPVRVKNSTAFDSLPYGISIAAGAVISSFL